MHAVMNSSAPFALTGAAGLLMMRIASAMRQVESKDRTRWCASCHRRISGRACSCSRKR